MKTLSRYSRQILILLFIVSNTYCSAQSQFHTTAQAAVISGGETNVPIRLTENMYFVNYTVTAVNYTPVVTNFSDVLNAKLWETNVSGTPTGLLATDNDISNGISFSGFSVTLNALFSPNKKLLITYDFAATLTGACDTFDATHIAGDFTSSPAVTNVTNNNANVVEASSPGCPGYRPPLNVFHRCKSTVFPPSTPYSASSGYEDNFFPVTIDKGDVLPVSIAGYDLVWFQDFDSQDLVTATEVAQIKAFIQAGGHVVWIGEQQQVVDETNKTYLNNTLIDVINNLYGVSASYKPTGAFGRALTQYPHVGGSPGGMTGTSGNTGSYSVLSDIPSNNTVYYSDIGGTCYAVTGIFPSKPVMGQGTLVFTVENAGLQFGDDVGTTGNDVHLLHAALINNDATALATINSWTLPATTPCTIIVLPVELIDFTAKCTDGVTLLKWSTASEISNDYFTIERITDADNFEAVGTVNGNGNSSVINNYNWKDNNPINGTAYYRLKQTDFNGAYEYLGIKTVTCEQSTDISIYPNPFENSFTIGLPENTTYPVTVEIVDYLGRTAHSQVIENATTEILLDEQISAGTYFVKVATETTQIVERIVKMK